MTNPVKPTFKSEFLPILIIIVIIALSVFFYPMLPEKVASHWNFKGEVDGWTSRNFSVIFLPALITGIYLLLTFLPNLDPKKENYLKFRNTYNIFKILIISVLGIIYIASLLYNVGYNVNIAVITPLLIGVMFIVMGNYMGKLKFNWFVGIKNPWTLSSENVWNKTHRLSGWLFIILGIILIISPFLPEQLGMYLLIGGVFAVVIGSFAYSYYLYTKEKK